MLAGAEDYFDSSYGFGDSWSYTETPELSCDLAVYPGDDQHCFPTFAFRNAGLLYHGLSTWDATERYAMYKSHVDDPLTFQDGGQLLYRVGDYINATAHTARCQTLGSGPGVHPSGCVWPYAYRHSMHLSVSRSLAAVFVCLASSRLADYCVAGQRNRRMLLRMCGRTHGLTASERSGSGELLVC